ncbi:MAG TPA: glycine cleavage T C-terminal barrel domain-containing protein, partial [Roseiflexaceae bacterium]|nr:glycine cleavage T C-terminal barrel domain-containing protein [Roseiflexaceae bacterium]
VATRARRRFSGADAGEPLDRLQPGVTQIGHVTYSNRGYTIGKTLALAYVQVQYAWPGSRVLVQVGERVVPATVTPTPFFDPQGARLRARSG